MNTDDTKAPERPAPGLYVVGTPIGHLEDFTFRALRTLKAADLILAEDTRITQRLLARYEIRAPLMSCHKFNEAARTEQVLDRLRGGAVIALVTDSGMPAVSAPGSRVVAACRQAALPVTAVPGPSAVTTALALSGFGGAAFTFAGFLPHKSGARRRRLARVAARNEPVVLFESPFRFLKLLDEIEAVAPARPVFVGRELTKLFEECRLGTAAELRAIYAGRAIKGEFVVILGPSGEDRDVEEEEDGDASDGGAPEEAGAGGEDQ